MGHQLVTRLSEASAVCTWIHGPEGVTIHPAGNKKLLAPQVAELGRDFPSGEEESPGCLLAYSPGVSEDLLRVALLAGTTRAQVSCTSRAVSFLKVDVH